MNLTKSFSVAASHLSQLASELATLPLSHTIHPPLLTFATSILLAGDMSLSTGTGRAFLLRSLEAPSLGIRLCGILSELGWGGWKLVGLPAVLKATPALLEHEPKLTIRLFTSLKKQGKISDVDVVWRRCIEQWVVRRLETWESEEWRVDDLSDILEICGFVGCLPRLLAGIANSSLDTPKPKANYESTYANAAWVVGLCMRTIASHHPSQWIDIVDLGVWTKKQDVVKRCLQGEEVSLDAHGVRERVLRIGRVEIIAQLKVNLRPLWSPATEALSSLSQRFGDQVWSLMFDELQAVSRSQSSDSMPAWMLDNQNGVKDSIDDPWEEERTWRDPSAHKVRSTTSGWLREDHQRNEIIRVQLPKDRIDTSSYESQLLSTLGECSALAEKHNRDLIPFFLSLTGPDASSRLPRYKLTSWLTLFSKFSNPKALHSSDTLFSLYMSFLSHPERSLQNLSLSCILTYKLPQLLAHEDHLRALLDDTRWRDELTTLDISAMEPPDRSQLVDIIIRLLFGIMLERKGRSRGADRRTTILSVLGGCTDEELSLLVDLMLKPMQSECQSRSEGDFTLRDISPDISQKQQIGFLTLLGDVLKNLGPHVISYWPALLGTTIDIISHAQERIASIKREDPTKVDKDEEQEQDEEDMEEIEDIGGLKSPRLIRQLGLKRLSDFFRSPVTFDFTKYLTASFSSFISPRLPLLDKENTQAPSGLLELFYAWASRPEYVQYLVQYDPTVLPKVYDCLVATNVKPVVITRILDIVDQILLFSGDNKELSGMIVKPHISLLLTNMAVLVERTKNDASISSPLSHRQIGILSEIAHYISDAGQSSRLLELLTPLLRKPSKVVPEKTKVNLLKILGETFPLIPDLSNRSSPIYIKVYELLSQLFQSLRYSQSRAALVATFQRLSTVDVSLASLASLLASLNAFSVKRLDEPDFECRLEAFSKLNEQIYASLSPHDWLPIIYNMLSFIQDPEELAVRNNASFTLRHFVDLASDDTLTEYGSIFMRILFPGLKNGLRSKHELVRSEVLSVVAYATSKCESIDSLQEMRPLLAGGDEEASFFTNIHHIQIHRRIRALRRLADQCDEGYLRSKTLADIFVPLVEHYILSTASLDHHLVNEVINTTGRMAKHLSWSVYYALVQKYLRASKDKTDAVRVHVRTLVAILESFHFPMDEVLPESTPGAEDDNELNEDVNTVEQRFPPTKVNFKKIEDAVNLRLLPGLLQYLEKRDETEDTLRIPISIGIVNVAKHLPQTSREPQICKLLTVLSQVLRSRSQETRDLTRDTLCRIIVLLGPTYLPLLLREMRGALLRGPQLHVLAYVTHALLTHITNAEHITRFSNLDECVDDVAHISAEVVFGESGKDVQSDDFKTKMREVRSSSSKGLDSFSLMAKYITPLRISALLLPVRSIMQETESFKLMLQVEEVLRRIASGLNANNHFTPPELLVLCHTLISQNARFLQEAAPPNKSKAKAKKDDAIVQMKRQSTVEVNHYVNNSFRFVTFGIDLFNTAFRRNRFDFHDAVIIARLEPMVKVIGNTLYSSNHAVITSGIKATAAIVKCPLNSIDKSAPVFVRQILDIIRQTGSTESDVVQTALKSLATILRDCSAAQVKEKDLVFLLQLLSPDLEDPTRQTAVFAMLRAIVARKFVVPEIYDLMDKVAEIMVTNQSFQVQELCRGVLLQFLLDYPQGKGRLRNQMVFLAKNLSYVYESGRKSVMEILSAIVAKFETGLVREYADLLFVALVMVIANDDSAKCREMAAELIKSLFSRLDDEHHKVVMNHLDTWATQGAQPQLTRVSIQVYGLVIDVSQQATLPYIPTLLQNVNAALKSSSHQIESSYENADEMDVDIEWQVSYQALVVLTKVLRVFPDFTPDLDKVTWPQVVLHLLFPHTWVRTAACRLLGMLFSATPITQPRTDVGDDHPQSVTGMRDIAGKLCTQLKSEHLDAPLSLQVVKNLFYIGKCFSSIPVPSPDAQKDDDQEVDEDDEDSEPGEEEVENTKEQNPLPWLFSKLSYQARSAHIARRNRSFSKDYWVHQPSSVFRWFAAMASYLDAARLETFLPHTLTPLYRILEDDTIRDPHMDELKTLATELQDLIQNKVGTTKFALAYNRIRQGVLTVRRERRTARVTQAVVNPEAAAKRKMQRNVVKKDSRKRKNRAYA
ncbi:hypothetical protein SERLADRAFT_367707 [Serpula lacrymans var. lacrymans S7.9]|uniref:Uncharacterized protein n=1 Tax=Serpula lacrymans var. lacrymans (strain S7.9) TaxID=578457 RepID=F8NQF0_SERL9|nr:uncharacterized protein SERLADRAFT_367707 [Serpula lacrymans var. lacrymans S7.9]EGO26080.1 hypothetical protein SERLADRAFT_367707 [Serpula lacrymans var. lacrymans S7.9]